MIEVNYLVVTPARNEERFIEKIIQSIVSQTILPQEWVIVDDGSTDKTKDIVLRYVREHEWIRLLTLPDRGKRQLGAAVVKAFDYGLRNARTTAHAFLCKLDADLTLPPNYFEFLFDRFRENPLLGISSGCTYVQTENRLVWERAYENHTRGMMKVYRKKCFQDIGGLVPELGWDVIDDFKAQAAGWETQNFKDLVVIHHRPMGSSDRNSLLGKVRWGYMQYALNYHPAFVLASSAYRMLERPYFIGGLAIVYGYLKSLLSKKSRIAEGNLKSFIRKSQLKRMKNITRFLYS